MFWTDLEEGDELEITDEAKSLMKRNEWMKDIIEMESIVLEKVGIIDGEIWIKIKNQSGTIRLKPDGKFYNHPPTVFKIKKLRDD